MPDSMKTELNSCKRFIHSQIEKPVEYLDTRTYMKGRWDRCIDHLYNIKPSIKIVFAHQHHFCHLFPAPKRIISNPVKQTSVSRMVESNLVSFMARTSIIWLFINIKSNKNNFFFWISRFHFLRYHGGIVSKSTLNFRLKDFFDICPKNADSA